MLAEVKGVDAKVQNLARDAIRDLLAYRRAFDQVLQSQPEPYGLAIAWGSQATPSPTSEISVCTPDTIKIALKNALA